VILDAYNNTWRSGGTSDYLTAESYTVGTMLTAMDEAGVEIAVVCSLSQLIDNDYIVAVVNAHSDRSASGRSTPATRRPSPRSRACPREG
jgi:uncharacterized protein